MNKLPAWIEALLLKAIKAYVSPDDVREAFGKWKDAFIAWAKEKAAGTAPTWDDKLVGQIEAALNGCTPDTQFLCDLIQKGEVAAVDLLRTAAKSTETELDDAAVDLIAAALGIEG